MRILIGIAVAFLMLLSCDDSSSKRHLLNINKDWNVRTETEKLIGCWCQDFGSHTSQRGLKIDFSTKYCYYSDRTMDEYLVSESYLKSTDLLRSGNNVTVSSDGTYSTNNILTFFDSESGNKKEFSIIIERYSIKIGRSKYIRCN